MIPVELTPSQERSVRLALKTARLASELRVANEKIARVEEVLARWDALSKGETATTRTLREALTP